MRSGLGPALARGPRSGSGKAGRVSGARNRGGAMAAGVRGAGQYTARHRFGGGASGSLDD